MAISYGGYRLHSRELQPTVAQLKADMKILAAMHVRVLRTYNTRYAEAANLLTAIRALKQEDPDFEMYVMLGAWIDCKSAWTNHPHHNDEDAEANAAEIQRAVDMATQYPDIVKIIAVGNEAMVKWAASYYVQPWVVLKYVNQLQALKKAGKLPKDLWITSSDNFASWGGGGAEYHVEDLTKLLEAVDYVSMHTYPMHDTHYNPAFWGNFEHENDLADTAKMAAAMARARDYAVSQYQSVATYMKGLGIQKPIHIGETGWATASNEHYGANGSKATDEYKAGLYYHLMREWTNREGIACFFFEAFDEIWKDAANPDGSENHFGLFTVDGKAKYAKWDLVDKGVFKNLSRGEQPIIKTYGGNQAALLEHVSLPPVKPGLVVDVFETSASGNKLRQITAFPAADQATTIKLLPGEKFQTITGFGGSFTESSASLLNKLSRANRDKIVDAYFGENGARYSLTRTHINSCDFSLGQYSYAPVAGDKALNSFSVEEDQDDIIPMIKDAMAASKDGFKIISSPWTAPPWMKDNNQWVGGKLLPEYYDTWALFFSKYIDAYKTEGIDIWGITVENEPLGNGNNWESMLFSPQEMTLFVQRHLGPTLEAHGKGHVKILGYDQNREHLQEWVDVMFRDEASSKYFHGTAIHWYASTFDVFPDALQYAHRKAPVKHLIQTEACVDAEVPHWQDDAWYWRTEATDWGWDWAPEKDKALHPKYAPVNRYAGDIIGCLNNWVDGWVDWNMVLDRQGGPNWFKNWCTAPVIVDPVADEVYFTPLYYTLAHFSRYIRPGAVRIGFEHADNTLQVTAAQNPDGSIAVIVFNPSEKEKHIVLSLGDKSTQLKISDQAIQTILIHI